MRIGIVSDIHGNFNMLLTAVRQMGEIDFLVHAGDGANDILRLQRYFSLRVEAVDGNCDGGGIFPEEINFQLDKYRVFLCHGHQFNVKLNNRELFRRAKAEKADIVIYGHTHQAGIHTEDGILFINPGSLSFARSYGGPSYAVLETQPGGELRHGIYHINRAI